MPQTEVSHEELSQILDSIQIPACPANLGQVMAEAQKDTPELKTLSTLVAADLGMAAAAIKLANSPLYRRGKTLDSVSQAVSHLGTRNILCVVIAVSLRSGLGAGLPAEWLEAFWRHAGDVAVGAGLIARQLRGVPIDTAYTYALFHDAAMPLLLKRGANYLELLDEAERRGLDQASLEHERLGYNHAQVGSLLARNWGMPDLLVLAIRAHHDADALRPGRGDLQGLAQTLIAICMVAEDLVAAIRGQQTVHCRDVAMAAAGFLGLSDDDLTDAREALEEALQA